MATRTRALVFIAIAFGALAPAAEEKADPKKGEAGRPAAKAEQRPADRTTGAAGHRDEAKPRPAKSKTANFIQIRSWIRALDSKKAEKRAAAKKHLLAHPDKASTELCAYIKGYPPPRRLAAVALLEALANKDSRKALAKRVLFDDNAEVRTRAIAAVRTMGGAAAMQTILGEAFAEKESRRQKAAEAIAAIGDKRYLDQLLHATTQRVAYAHARVDVYAQRQSIEKMDRAGMRGDWTDLAVDLPTTKRARVHTTIWTLCTVAGKDFGTNMKRWHEWWKANRKDFAFPGLEKKRGKE